MRNLVHRTRRHVGTSRYVRTFDQGPPFDRSWLDACYIAGDDRPKKQPKPPTQKWKAGNFVFFANTKSEVRAMLKRLYGPVYAKHPIEKVK